MLRKTKRHRNNIKKRENRRSRINKTNEKITYFFDLLTKEACLKVCFAFYFFAFLAFSFK